MKKKKSIFVSFPTDKAHISPVQNITTTKHGDLICIWSKTMYNVILQLHAYQEYISLIKCDLSVCFAQWNFDFNFIIKQ